MIKKIKKPFFVVNPKSFLYGNSLIELAKSADELAKRYKIDILFTALPTELSILAVKCPHLFITAQHIDSTYPGDKMGKILGESLKNIGVQAVVLNHADNPLTMQQIYESIKRTKEIGLRTIVCANSVWEAKSIAELHPDIVLAEPTELIGNSQISSQEYVKATISSIKEINNEILVEQGAGIRTEEDVQKLLQLGADGVGVTSGIINNKSPVGIMERMIKTIASFKS